MESSTWLPNYLKKVIDKYMHKALDIFKEKNKPYLDGNEVYVKSYSVREDSNKNKLVISFKNRFEAEQYVSSNNGQKLKVVEEYLETGEKKATEPNYERTHVFPRMYSSQGSHIQQYKI